MWDFCICDRFLIQLLRQSHSMSWMVHAGCVFQLFVAGIHLSRTWMSGSFESMWWNVCVHRLDLSLCSHPKEFWGNKVRTLVNSKGKIPFAWRILLRGGSNPRCCIKQDSEPSTLPIELFRPQPTMLHQAGQCCSGPTHDAASSRPNTLPIELFWPNPRCCIKQAQHTTNWAVLAQPTMLHQAGPTHYQLSCSGPTHDAASSRPNTLPIELFWPNPRCCIKQAQHTTNWAVLAQPTMLHQAGQCCSGPTHDAASSRTVSPTHYQLSCSGPTHDAASSRTVLFWLPSRVQFGRIPVMGFVCFCFSFITVTRVRTCLLPWSFEIDSSCGSFTCSYKRLSGKVCCVTGHDVWGIITFCVQLLLGNGPFVGTSVDCAGHEYQCWQTMCCGVVSPASVAIQLRTVDRTVPPGLTASCIIVNWCDSALPFAEPGLTASCIMVNWCDSALPFAEFLETLDQCTAEAAVKTKLTITVSFSTQERV